MNKIFLLTLLFLSFLVSCSDRGPKIESLTCISGREDCRPNCRIDVVIDHENKTVKYNLDAYNATMIDDEVHFGKMQVYTQNGKRRLMKRDMVDVEEFFCHF